MPSVDLEARSVALPINIGQDGFRTFLFLEERPHGRVSDYCGPALFSSRPSRDLSNQEGSSNVKFENQQFEARLGIACLLEAS